MDKQELANKSPADKPPMATPGFKIITPKEETEYDRKIREEQERQMMDCCDGYSPYDQYGYKPRPKNPSQDAPHRDAPHRGAPANPESPPAHSESLLTSESQSVPQTEKKTNKR